MEVETTLRPGEISVLEKQEALLRQPPYLHVLRPVNIQERVNRTDLEDNR